MGKEKYFSGVLLCVDLPHFQLQSLFDGVNEIHRCSRLTDFPPVNDLSMGAQFSSATLDDATVALIKRKTRMKSSEITDWFNELKVRIPRSIQSVMREWKGEISDLAIR